MKKLGTQMWEGRPDDFTLHYETTIPGIVLNEGLWESGVYSSAAVYLASPIAVEVLFSTMEDNANILFPPDPSSPTPRVLPDFPTKEDRSTCVRWIEMCQLRQGSYCSSILD